MTDQLAAIPPIAETPLTALLRWRAQHQSNAIALRQKDHGIWKPVTWAGYLDAAETIAHGLAALDIGAGAHVAVLSENRKEWVFAQMGIGLARAVCVGTYPTSPADEVAHVLEHSQCVAVICEDQEQADKLLELKDQLTGVQQVIVIDMKGMRTYDDPWLMSFDALMAEGARHRETARDMIKDNLAQQDIDDVALMVYTSGSTGKSKGAMLTWRNISVAAASAIDANHFNSADSCVSYLPLCHVAEQLITVTTGIGAGIQVNFGESLRTIQSDLREIAPTTFLAVPRIWEKMHSTVRVKLEEAGGVRRWLFNRAYATCEPFCEVAHKDWSLGQRLKFLVSYWLVFRALQNQLGLRRARIMLSGAAPISPELLKFFRAIGLHVREAFGMTETAALGFMQDADHYISGTVGFPLAMVEAKVAADGELLMRGPMVFKGYYRDAAATADTLRDGWLYTGDLAEEVEGQFRIVGRKKEILITAGGKNLSPAEIENNLKVSPYIKEAIVCGDGKPYLTALIQIDYDNVANWAERKGHGFTNFRNLAESNEVRVLIDAEVTMANERVARVAGVKQFVLLAKELDHDDDEMTATQKIRRHNIHEKYADLIESLYQMAPQPADVSRSEPSTART